MTTGVERESKRLLEVRFRPRDPPLIVTESARLKAVRDAAALPARERLPPHVSRSLRGYERLWRPAIDPPETIRQRCWACGQSEGKAATVVNGEKRGPYCVRCGRAWA